MTKDELLEFRNKLIQKKENNYITMSKINDIRYNYTSKFEFENVETIKKQIQTSDAIAYFEEICKKMTELYEEHIEFDEIRVNISIEFYINEICAKKIVFEENSKIKPNDILPNIIKISYSTTPYLNNEKVETGFKIKDLYKNPQEYARKKEKRIIEYDQFITEIKKLGYNIMSDAKNFEKLINYIQDRSIYDIPIIKIKFKQIEEKSFLLSKIKTIFKF